MLDIEAELAVRLVLVTAVLESGKEVNLKELDCMYEWTIINLPKHEATVTNLKDMN